MSKNQNREIKLPSIDKLFSSQEERDDAKLCRIEEIPLDKKTRDILMPHNTNGNIYPCGCRTNKVIVGATFFFCCT